MQTSVKVNGIYTINNPYGYKLNINHPKIKELFLRYKRKNNLPENLPVSDANRFEFEAIVLKKIASAHTPPNASVRRP